LIDAIRFANLNKNRFWLERSAILDTSKFVRIAVDWLLRSDIGQVIKTIVDDEAAFPDYAMPKKTARPKKGRRMKS